MRLRQSLRNATLVASIAAMSLLMLAGSAMAHPGHRSHGYTISEGAATQAAAPSSVPEALFTALALVAVVSSLVAARRNRA